ncbi:Synemin, partial [Eschrichtius robustus]|nr:Synemin [Eschrichtius robustus]
MPQCGPRDVRTDGTSIQVWVLTSQQLCGLTSNGQVTMCTWVDGRRTSLASSRPSLRASGVAAGPERHSRGDKTRVGGNRPAGRDPHTIKMLSWRLQTGSEKAELQELNARLYDYVCRVRELERENLLLEEELRGRRGYEGLWAEAQARFAKEARSLRQQLDELSWATALAEGERDALRRELQELQLLGEEARAARGRLDAELDAQRWELQEGKIACLEDEKAALTLAMADRLRDYQELVQVKTGLSLEVATYRALLEGESNPEIQILTERIENVPQAENIVSSILKQFTHSPETEASADSFPDTKVTYMDRKELPGDRETKTEIVVESKLTEEVDISDEAGLDYLLSKDAKEVKLKGKSAEHLIGDIIGLGLKGREGRAKVVNVEIIEEPVSYVSGEKADEFSTPFEVEEVDDVSSGSKGLVVEEEVYRETDTTCSGNEGQKTRQPQENITHFEEVTEAGDLEGEQSYLVSTPDEYPGGHERVEGSVYGQIHIEEESTIRYSWQDEIVPGSRRRMEGDDALGEKVVKPLDVPEASLEGDMGSTHWKGQARSGEFHAEPIVIEKEIKIPHEFHTSIKGGFKEPRHQLVEVIEQLEESLPERMKEELSAFTGEGQGGPGGVSVDVKKVQTVGGGAVTLVAEVNLSQTVDADQLDLEELSRDEAGEIEKAVESVVRDGLARRHSPAPGSPDGEARAEAPAASHGFKRWATQELYSPSGEEADAGRASPRTELVTSQGPMSATVEVTSPRGFAQSHVLEDVSQSVRHVQIEPPGTWRTEQVSPEGPAAQVVEVSGEGDLSWAASSAAASLSARHLTLGPDQSQLSKEVFFPGPDPPCPGAGDSEEPGPAELSTDPDRSGRHRPFGSQQFHSKREIIFQAPASEAGKVGDYFSTEESAGTQTSVKHLQLGPREGFSEQIQLTAPLSDRMELGVREASVRTEVWSGNGTSIRHIKTVPQRHQGTEQIVPPPSEFSDSESKAHREGSADVTQATRSYTVGRKILMTEKSTFQTAVSESPQEAGSGDTSGAEATSGVSRSFRHIQLGPAETNTSAHVVFHGPISKTFALAGSVDSPEVGEVADSGRTLRHVALGPKETSFTFQMDVSNVETTPRWTREATVLFPTGTEAEARSVSDRDAWRDASSRNDLAAGVSFQGSAGDRHQAPGEKGKEQAEFDKMVQLQRMVDQRSVISDEKKVALLYLDNQEEENEGHWF